MNVIFEHRSEMTFIGYSTLIDPGEGFEKCPKFWSEEYAERYARLLRTGQPETEAERSIVENRIGTFGICAGTEKGLEYYIAGLYRGGTVPDGFRLFTCPESDWAEFSTKGPLPEAIQKLNSCIRQEWLPGAVKACRLDTGVILEVYRDGDQHSPDYECGIWIPMRGSSLRE